MIDITVLRGSGDIIGEVVSNPLLEKVPVAIQYGRNLIDRNAKMRPVSMETRYRQGLETGKIIEVLDALQGTVWRGKIRSVDIAVEGVETTVSLRVEKV